VNSLSALPVKVAWNVDTKAGSLAGEVFYLRNCLSAPTEQPREVHGYRASRALHYLVFLSL
jgi:hypothetical protein